MIGMTQRCEVNFDDVLEDDEPGGELLPESQPMVPSLEEMLQPKGVRSVEDILDYASTCALAVANGNVPAKLSKELRLWGELMYSCIQSQNMLGSDGDVNFIGQLIQIAGNPDAPTLAQAMTVKEEVPAIIDAVAVKEQAHG
jgi:hypothetical protein